MTPPSRSPAPPADPWAELLRTGGEDGRLVREAYEGARAPVLEPVPDDLHPALLAGLARAGIDELYRHQAHALQAAADGPFVVTTGTASGKSLCFNLPTLDVLCSDAKARAFYLYPTKALAQDQARALHALRLTKQLRPAIYDGDTRVEDRREIRRRANLVLTNPDMLHMGILPHHRLWADAFANLAVVVIDEAHVYRGVFGSHVANVLRRLRRIARAYGTEPRFLLASATIANPVELAQRLTGLPEIEHVDEDGSPGAARRIAMWNPPVTDEALQTRRSARGEAADVVVSLVQGGARVICFVKSRGGVELVAKMVKDKLDPDLADKVIPYRAGYTPQQRRELEGRLMRGETQAVITTNALELGIDIGELDAAVCVEFPGTVASLRQMWGRAGRRGRGLAVYVAGEDSLDQFFCRHPDEFLDRPVEAAILDHTSEEIHHAHLVCAAHEGPLDPRTDVEVLGPDLVAHCEQLVAQGTLVQRRGQYVLRAPEDFPAGRVSLRSSSTDQFAVVDVRSGEMLGTVEGGRAYKTLHDGSIYLHQARSYEVRELDLRARHALVEPFHGDWYTQAKQETMTHIEKLLDRRDVLGVTLSFGIVSVTDQVLAYQRKKLQSHEVIDLHTLDLPPTTFTTQALWYELGPEVLGVGPGQLTTSPEALPLDLLLGSLHAAEHAQIAVLPLLAMCDRWDIGGLSTNAHPQTGGPTIFIYDGHPGGIGITRQGFARFEQLTRDAQRLIGECPCEHGCPSCVQSPKCGNLNDHLHKAGALHLLRAMLAQGAPAAAQPGGGPASS
ncbi:DEAD/DEAH box helicase [Paraconexibacter algicola]|uniref:DEAD/DEAH box helicase n=1 Tax=Paraconexibacter algicola TaxID=2133960 RepID=A0A2T4UKN8_9ACTN|nr:DEAD/DEAH box helicase [Paraconexibacter algicola]PTL59775.1 DEAD/DEAH box helicase [Paraconexibacter algicola]